MKQNSYTYEELLKCGQGKLFGLVNRLPLPNMLMLDRIVHISEKGGSYGKGEIVAELDIHPDLWFFSCHFSGDPVMPGCLGLDAMWQLVGFFLAWQGHRGKGRALGVGEVEFSDQILPSTPKITYQINIKKVVVRKLVLGVADGSVSVDGRQIYTAREMKVGLFPKLGGF